MRKICHFVWILHEIDTFVRLKGKQNNYYKNVEKAYNFRIKSGIGKWYINRPLQLCCVQMQMDGAYAMIQHAGLNVVPLLKY